MKIEWHNEKRKLKELIPTTYNPRKLTKKQYRDMENSLKKFNLAEIPCINLDKLIIDRYINFTKNNGEDIFLIRDGKKIRYRDIKRIY